VTRSAGLGTGSSRLGRETGAMQEADLAARAASGWTAAVHERRRTVVAWVLGIAGLAAYNWWLLVPLKPGLMTSPSELFSNLEVSGQPYATAMQHADLGAGLLLIAAFWAAGHGTSLAARREWLSMLVFAAAGALGGLFPEVCADGVNAVCRRQEYRFELPASQYIHTAAGILEFAAITVALLYAVRRTRHEPTRPAAAYRALAVAALVAYPLLGGAYLFDRFGGIMEAVFFAGFTVMVITQLGERTAAARAAARGVAPIRQYCRV
jgi:Protein of unknown function (DUF998)